MSERRSRPHKKLLAIIALATILLAAVLIARAMMPPPALPPLPPQPSPTIDADAAAQRLSAAVRLPTISTQAGDHNATFLDLHSLLAELYPLTHSALSRETINTYSLLYTWQGADPSLPPILLTGHMDVVPVDDAQRTRWSHDPFGGVIEGGFVWGRGTLDDKNCVLGLLEAVEHLLASGFKPQRTILLAFGHDEEISGQQGAMKIAATLKARGVKAQLLLDEGHAITRGIMPGIAQPVALIGLSEKGFVSLELVVKAKGGHSSMPPPTTALGQLARAITRVEDNPIPGDLDGPTGLMFEQLSPHMAFGNRIALRNLWLLKPVVLHMLSQQPTTNAVLRTTTAVTMASASEQDNVLPAQARAVINHRIRPGDTVATVQDHIRRVIDDPEVEVRLYNPDFASDPSPVASHTSPGFMAIRDAIRHTWPDTLVSPALTIAATDARHYREVADDLYRFAPIILTPEDTARLHGVDERIGVKDYADGIRFYVHLLRQSAGAP